MLVVRENICARKKMYQDYKDLLNIFQNEIEAGIGDRWFTPRERPHEPQYVSKEHLRVYYEIRQEKRKVNRKRDKEKTKRKKLIKQFYEKYV